jgi:UDP-N-acetyl-D-galactosamine dehydrogenase
MYTINNIKLCIIGLGYVGLPLAIAFEKKMQVVGYDINQNRIDALKKNNDSTLEISSEELSESKNLLFTHEVDDIKNCNFYIITVPTPIDEHNQPDLRPIISATELISKVLKKGDIVVYESTVYPGCTEEICAPIIEKNTSLILNKDFFLGYSPERINPGDKIHTVSNIVKITSGSTKKSANLIDDLYRLIIKAGTYKASSIKVAEAAKVIENTQRDINIAFVNELSIIFRYMNLDTKEVLDAASSKWNFLPFVPGLVGGHCIGVDPYYLAYKAQYYGYSPEVILSGRRVNNSIAKYIVDQSIKKMLTKKIELVRSRTLVLGVSFKENCPDFRNSKVIDIINNLKDLSMNFDVYDPMIDREEFKKENGFSCLKTVQDLPIYDLIIIAVAHDAFKMINKSYIAKICKTNRVIFDVKGVLEKGLSDLRL